LSKIAFANVTLSGCCLLTTAHETASKVYVYSTRLLKLEADVVALAAQTSVVVAKFTNLRNLNESLNF